ncbi:MAG: hypothetical protein GY771_13375 [bacterium]|nr:hypothetical protein [bacterium]
MSKEIDKTIAPFAIDCNGDGRLLTDMEPDKCVAQIDSQWIVPSAAAIYSLFSENSLFLNQD